jgi:hypothetical protein
MRRKPCGFLFETSTWKPPGKVLVYAIMPMRAELLRLPVHPQKGNMSNVQPVVDADSTAWSAVSAKETYGSSCGATSIPYAMPMIICPAMLHGDMNCGSTTKKKPPTTVDDVYNLQVYEVDSQEVGEQLSALEADIVDWHWGESVHGILCARFATSDHMEETRCSSSYVAYMETGYLQSLSRNLAHSQLVKGRQWGPCKPRPVSVASEDPRRCSRSVPIRIN